MAFTLAILGSPSLIVPLTYFLLMRRAARSSWNFVASSGYSPRVSIVMSLFNEQKNIEKKLENLKQIQYPHEKLELIIVDDNSSDSSADLTDQILKARPLPFKTTFLRSTTRRGKASELNYALKFATGEVIATTDADTLWPPDSLAVALRYLSSESIGAVTGREIVSNAKDSVNALAEQAYRSIYDTLREGESKIHSTIIFDGALALFKRSAMDHFEERISDDTGTTLQVIKRGFRAVFAPDALFYDASPKSTRAKLKLKSRRARNLMLSLLRALKTSRRSNHMPLKLLLINIYLHFVNPFFFIIFVIGLMLLFVTFPPIILVAGVLVPEKVRVLAFSFIMSNVALVIGLVYCVRGKKNVWLPVREN
jgi:biofilm PGA synthesis N-glycosyltransferase PgaC